MQPTDEQAHCIKIFKKGGNLAIEAGAGTGKTSTLVLLGEAAKSRRGQYLAFNKAIVEDAKKRMPPNVQASTMHSLAFGAFGKRYARRLNAREPEDPGVAVYFEYKGRPMCFACDQYRKTRENIRAISLTIAAIRAIERYGSSDMMERAFRGFTAIPEVTGEPWRTVFGFSATDLITDEQIDAAFRKLALTEHPDHGGSSERFQRILNARKDARRAIGATA